jgi:hypothetical protein
VKTHVWSACALGLLLLVAPECRNEGSHDDRPLCEFSGITAVDAQGNFQSTDPDDWCWMGQSGVPHTLRPAWPNPAADSCSLRYTLEYESEVHLILIGPDCSEVRVLKDGISSPGPTWLVWDLRDGRGNRVPPGIYRCQMTAGSWTCHGDIQVLEPSAGE